MEKLPIVWHAQLKDKTMIHQYEGDKENLFQLVLDRLDDLQYFSLEHTETGRFYVVDLTRGVIFYSHKGDPLLQPRADMLRKLEYKYRLIYFREVERHFNNSMQEIGVATRKYFVGFQYTDENDKNHKRIMKIDVNGTFVIN